MRNLKRALSLTLASVMLLGMMVVGAGAVGYPDVADEDNVEAIEVLQSVGVMEGDNNGNFNPDDYVTREQMAVIMSKLLNLNYNYYQGTNPFSDVPAWAAPYVAACAANGITSGIGGGMYGAGQNVNAVQAALMMLKALGYFQYQADFGEDYVLATVKQATEVGLFNQIDSKAEQALTRNEVAQMALNALKSDLVRFTGDPGVEYTGSNGESWIGGYKAEYTPRTSTDPKYDRLIDNKHSSDIDRTGQYYIQLGEELYNGDLVQRYDSDIFERPSYTWTYKTELIGTYVDREKFLASYTSGVSGRTLYDLLNNITIREYTLETYVDGHPANNSSTAYSSQYNYAGTKEVIDQEKDLVRSNTDDVGITADGVETEVYLDRTNKIITIVSMHTWLAKANNTYNEDRESASMKVYETSATGKTKVVEPDEAPEVVNVTQDNYYLVKMSDKDTVNLEVVKIMEPTILADSTITKFSTSNQGVNGKVTKLTTGGTEYKKNEVAYYDDDILDNYNDNLLSNATYNVYLDQNGYFAGVDLYDGDKNYVFITGYDMRNSNLSVQTATANGIFLDGTMENITVNVQDTNKNIDKLYTSGNANSAYYVKWASHESDGVYLLNRWYTYTKTDSNVYTLKPCYNASTGEILMFATSATDAADLTLKCDRVTLDGTSSLLQGETMKYTTDKVNTSRAYGEDDSVFIAVDTDDVSAAIQKGSTKLAVTKAITDVKGVYTGVQNVELIAKSSDRVQGQYLVSDSSASSTQSIGENVYTVYDKDHYIIGSVILGSTKGGVENYAYILDPVKSEEKKDDGYYYWEFEAVYQGEIKTFQAKTKYLSTIDLLKSSRYRIVELRFDGEYVVDAETIKSDEIYGDIFNEIKRPVAETENVYDVVLKDSTNFVRVGRDTTSAATQIGTLYLQGKTLYVLGKPASTPTADNDRGLALVRDAKAVVRQQDKNGDMKNYQFSSVDEAYSWLNDADGSRDNGLQYKGIITAVLNSQGVAEWVVFYNDNPWNATSSSTGDGSGTGDSTEYVTIDEASYNDRTGNVSFRLTVKRPDWIPASATATVGYTVKINGSWAATDTTTIGMGAATNTKRVSGGGLNSLAMPGDTLSVEIDSVSFDKVKVLFVLDEKDTTNTVNLNAAGTNTAEIKVNDGTGETVTYTLSDGYNLTTANTSIAAKTDVTLSNLKEVSATTFAAPNATTGVGSMTTLTAINDKDYARIVFDSADLVARDKQVQGFAAAAIGTTWGSTNAAGDTGTVAVNHDAGSGPANASVAAGTNVTFTVTLAPNTTTGVPAYRVQIAKLGFDEVLYSAVAQSETLAAKLTGTVTVRGVDKDYIISTSDVVVTPVVAKAEVESVTWTATQIRINLTEPLAAVEKADGTASIAKGTFADTNADILEPTLTNNGKTIVIDITGGVVAAGDTLTLTVANMFGQYDCPVAFTCTTLTLAGTAGTGSSATGYTNP